MTVEPWHSIFRYRISPTHSFDYVSPAATVITGHTPEELHADPDLLIGLIHPDDVARWETFMDASRRVPDLFSLRVRHRNRPVIWIRLDMVPVLDQDGAVVAVDGAVRDVVAAGATYEAVRYSERICRWTDRALLTLRHCNRAMIQATDEAALLESICHTVIEVGGYRMAWVGYAERRPEQIVRPVAHYGHDAEYLQHVRFTWSNAEDDSGLFSRAIGSGAPCVVRNVQSQLASLPWLKEMVERGYASLVVLPLIADKDVRGVLTVYASETDAFSEGDLGLLSELADDLAYGIATLRTRARRQQAEVALRMATDARRESETKLRALVEQSTVGIVLVNEAAIVEEWNPAQASLTGLSRAEAVGRSLQEIHVRLVPKNSAIPAPVDRLNGALAELPITGQATGLAQPHEDLVIQRPDGELRSVASTFFPIELARSTMYGAVFRDVTKRRQEEKALRAAQRLESVGVLAGGIAHDFNNLLGSMLGETTLALARLENGHPARVYIHKAVASAERAADLTRQLLAYVGKGQVEIEPVDLNYLIRQNAELLLASLPKEVPLELDLMPDLPRVLADAAQLQQVVMNLAINAAEAVQARLANGADGGTGKVSLQTRSLTLDAEDLAGPWVGTAAPQPGHFAALIVRDDGIGMDEDTLGRIFDPFFTTKTFGRGLGLAALLGIVRAHKGCLQVTSQLGQGTTFTVMFPLQEHSAGPGQAPDDGMRSGDRSAQSAQTLALGPVSKESERTHEELLLRPMDTRGGTVLVIDDEEPIREALTDILEIAGIAVITAANGQEGVQSFAEHRAEIGLVILDLLMPVMSGEKTLLALRQIDEGVKILLSSGYDETEAVHRFSHRSMREQPTDFLQKPYSVDTVVGKVQALLYRE